MRTILSKSSENEVTRIPLPIRQADEDTRIFNLRQKAGRAEAVASSLAEFANSLASLSGEDDVLWDITRRCILVLNFEAAVIFLVDPIQLVLVQKAAFGPKYPEGRNTLSPLTIPIGEGIVGSVGHTGVAEVISDTRTDPRTSIDKAIHLSEISVPIVSEGRVLGVIDSQHSQADFFTEEHLTVLTAIAAICATRLERAHAERALRDLNNELEERVRSRTAELASTNARLEKEICERARTEAALKESSQRLRESEERFRKAFRSIPAHVSIVRLSDRRFIEVNEGFVSDSGYKKSEIIGKTSMELNLWGSDQARETFFEKFLNDGFVHSFEAEFRSKNGRIDAALISAERIEIDQQPCVLALSLTITDRKRAEEELKLSLDRERELNRLRTSFVSLVSHEFRTPLGIIHSSAEILERYIDRLPEKERLLQLRAIQSHALRMNGLMEGVLVFGRAEAGRLEFRPIDFDWLEATRKWSEEARTSTNNKCDINITMGNIPRPAHGDPELIRHITTNLLSNAIKYSPAGSPIELLVDSENGDGVLRIRDRGIGIPDEDRQKLFTAFHRGRNVGQAPGTGLGLVVIRHCLDHHHGSIDFESNENSGTTVTVRIPLFHRQPPEGVLPVP